MFAIPSVYFVSLPVSQQIVTLSQPYIFVEYFINLYVRMCLNCCTTALFVWQEIQAHYDEIQRQLAVTLDQYAIASRKVQSLTCEIEEIRANYDNALRGKRHAEQMYEDSQSRVNELTTINVNLSASRSKLEQEFSSIASDYEEVTKELRVSSQSWPNSYVNSLRQYKTCARVFSKQ